MSSYPSAVGRGSRTTLQLDWRTLVTHDYPRAYALERAEPLVDRWVTARHVLRRIGTVGPGSSAALILSQAVREPRPTKG